MSLPYIPPGVTVQELTSTALSPLLATPGSLCLVGIANGLITRTDTIKLSGTTAVVLPGLPNSNGTLLATLNAVTLVIDAINPSLAPSGFSSTTDYTVNLTNGTIVRQVTATTTSGSSASGQAAFTLAGGPVPAVGQVVRLVNTGGSPVQETVTVKTVVGQVITATTSLVNTYASGAAASWGPIPDGDTVYVTYQYTPLDYFQAIQLSSMADIQNRFGNAWDPTGTFINSPLSFAASMAFQNGASNLILQPLYFLNASTGLPQQPNATQAATPATWATVFNSLLPIAQQIDLLVPVVGQSQAQVTDSVQLQIEQAAQDFVYASLVNDNAYVDVLFGEDSSASSSVAQDATLIAHAQTLLPRYNSAVTQQCIFVNTSQFLVANRTSTLLIGGQYVAAAVAGMLSSRGPSAPITRQTISGILSVTDLRTTPQKNNDANNGMLVVENNGPVVWVRHGITMDNTSVVTREINVVRGKEFIVDSVRETLDTQVIGKVVADVNAPTTINNLVIGTLENLRASGDLSAYNNVQSQITTIDPTAMVVTFSYQPIFIINYITVQFSIDLTNQTVSVLGATITSSTS